MHVFLSYARSTEEPAAHVERALRKAGYTVWRDTDLPAHLSYAEVIEERLKSAKAVLVLWSAEAARSQWVRAEADTARELGTLIQSSVDGTIPPIPFNQIQCADLKGWNGDNDHPGWRKLQSSVVALAGQAQEPAQPAKRERPANSICVLPFQNMSGDEVPDYFSEGITEDITSDLSKISALSVIPRKVAFQFKGQEVDASSVAEKLNVNYVLEGAVRRAGNRVRITAQLIDGVTGDNVWSDRYYREFSDVFSVQDEISKAIVSALEVKLLPAEKKMLEERDTSNEDHRATSPELGKDSRLDRARSAPQFAVHNGPVPEPEIEMQPPQVAFADSGVVERHPEAETYPSQEWDSAGGWNSADEWSSAQEWDSGEDWDSAEETTKRDYLNPGLAPRLVALGVALLLIAVFVGVTFWPNRSPAVAEQEKVEGLAYTVTAPVNVRSLPRKTSRVLGQLEEGATINIVPALAGAQPDWVKIMDGPYVGGYVWRESTRPLAVSGDASAKANGKAPTPSKDVTG